MGKTKQNAVDWPQKEWPEWYPKRANLFRCLRLAASNVRKRLT